MEKLSRFRVVFRAWRAVSQRSVRPPYENLALQRTAELGCLVGALENAEDVTPWELGRFLQQGCPFADAFKSGKEDYARSSPYIVWKDCVCYRVHEACKLTRKWSWSRSSRNAPGG